MKKIIIIGCGGHATSCIEIIKNIKSFKIVGLICKKIKNNNNSHKIIGTDNDLKKLKKKYTLAVNCIGQIKSPLKRIKIYKKLKGLGFILPKIIANTAYISKESFIDESTVIMNFAFINANVKIGRNTIINTKAIIEHDAQIGSHCHISTGAVVNGGAIIGDGTFVGSGAVINQDILIGKNCIIGSNTKVFKNLKANTIVK
jgi:sugar O-acyltransferase (sialic acid O-acetyltransferase NeuD family)